MEKQPIITVKNLVKNYGDFHAVKGISFEVYEGEIFGLLGPNGAGKTTTLEIIETLRDKTSGDIIVDGFNIDTDAASIKKRIGVQLQAAGYYPNLNLSELIDLFSGLYGIDRTAIGRGKGHDRASGTDRNNGGVNTGAGGIYLGGKAA